MGRFCGKSSDQGDKSDPVCYLYYNSCYIKGSGWGHYDHFGTCRCGISGEATLAIPDFQIKFGNRDFALVASGEEEILPELVLLLLGLCPQKSGLGHVRQVLLGILEW